LLPLGGFALGLNRSDPDDQRRRDRPLRFRSRGIRTGAISSCSTSVSTATTAPGSGRATDRWQNWSRWFVSSILQRRWRWITAGHADLQPPGRRRM